MSGLRTLLLRDLAIVSATAGVWALTLRAGPDAAWPLAVLAAVATAVAGYLVHEWGHLLGALAVRSRVALPARPFESAFLFRFDTHRNTARQFCAMSLGGFASSLAAVVFLVLALPAGWLATQLSLGLVALGVGATLVLEVPVLWRVWRGGPLPRGAAFVGGEPGT